MRHALLPGFLAVLGALACAADAPPPAADASAQQGPALDEDGVVMLHASKPGGPRWRLGDQDPNAVGAATLEVYESRATRGSEGPLTYWTTRGEVVTSPDLPEGRTARLYVRTSGVPQQYAWNRGAAEHGYLAGPADVVNFEATAYVRVRGYLGAHTSMSWLLRGGLHTERDGDLASCVGLQIPYAKQTAKAFREYHHPDYDYVLLEPRTGFTFREGAWLATKVVSWRVPGGTMNRVYVDPAPWTPEGRPRNAFELLLEWDDRDGVSTGRYARAATWGGYQTSFRVDGFDALDFAILSVREIVPPG